MLEFLQKLKTVSKFLFIFTLTLFVWWEDTTWLTSKNESLLLLLGWLPLIVSSIKNKRNLPTDQNQPYIWLASSLFFIGILSGLTILMAISVALFCFSCFRHIDDIKSISIILVFTFPWQVNDFPELANSFRLIASYASYYAYDFMDLNVAIEGTSLFVSGLKISVNEDCSGMLVLQIVLLLNLLINQNKLNKVFALIINIFVGLIYACLLNTIRVFIISSVALGWGIEWVSGIYHETIGALFYVIAIALLYYINCGSKLELNSESK